ncbi:hypothetical protein J4438_03260 [Candidatus Woesearchaeota archaeon]|nr:hypothetical protein [Candidatus Woesearchaeota archaeon]
MDEEILKKAFSKVKEDISSINMRIDSLERSINSLISQNNEKKQANPLNSSQNDQFKPQIPMKKVFSSGNEGVQSINHSTINQSITDQSHNLNAYSRQIKENYDDKPEIQENRVLKRLSTDQSLINQSLSIQSLKKDLEDRFSSLTSQEFLIFLTIYQIEEDIGRPVTYNDLANKLSLTSGCIRGYVSSIMRKGLPLNKLKINNRTLTLSIKPDFKELNIKERLINLFYGQDPEQTRLFRP